MGIFGSNYIKIDPSLLFVCTGNICRSAYAEKYYRAKAEEWDYFVYKVSSAGTGALNGIPMDSTVRDIAQTNGLDTSHVSQKIDLELIDSYGLIVVMEERQRQEVVAIKPSALKRTFLLIELAKICETIDNNLGLQNISWVEFTQYLQDYRINLSRNDIEDIEDPYKKDLTIYSQSIEAIEKCVDKLVLKFK